MLGPLFLEDPEDCGDLYYDIAEAYMENGMCPCVVFMCTHVQRTLCVCACMRVCVCGMLKTYLYRSSITGTPIPFCTC